MSGSPSSPSQSHAGPDPAWTSRQREVLGLLVRGQTNAQIAQALGISLDGAKWHVSEVITKLGVDSRDEAAEYWRAQTGVRLRFTRIIHGLIASIWLKVAGAGAVVAGASVAVAIVITGLNDSGTSPVGAVATPTTTPSDALDAVRQRLKNQGSAADVVDAAVGGDIDKLASYLQLSPAVCQQPSDHGEPVSCDKIGLAPGTPVQVAMVGGAVTLRVPQQIIRQFLDKALADKHGRLVFVGKTPDAVVVGIGFPAVTPPLTGLVVQPYSLFMFEVVTSQPTAPIVRTWIVVEGSTPGALFAEVYGSPGNEIWYSETTP